MYIINVIYIKQKVQVETFCYSFSNIAYDVVESVVIKKRELKGGKRCGR